ncbi:unnamed protein product, partial [Didymodactylos carnosus]
MSINTSAIYFLDSNKGYRQLIRDDFIYKCNKQTTSKICWICKTKNCKAKVHTDPNDNFLSSSGDHNRLLEPEDFEVQCFRKILKDRVINETAPISKLYAEEIAKTQFSSETLARLNQARRQLTSVLPASASFDIPDCYQITATGEIFLISYTL